MLHNKAKAESGNHGKFLVYAECGNECLTRVCTGVLSVHRKQCCV